MTATIQTEARYPAFIERYAFDISRFAIEVVGMTPTDQQIELFEAVSPQGSRTTVRSGHGTGKSRGIAVMTLWHLLCYVKSNTLITAPKIEQVRNVAWKEIADVLDLIRDKGAQPWIYEHVKFEAERIYIQHYKETWFVIAKTAPRGNPENLAGMHRDWYLIIADEASGIPDPNYGVLTGALTDSRNRILLQSQPTRPAGFFYDTHHRLAKENGGVWVSLHMDSHDSPLVSKAFIEEKRQEYTEEEFTIKVRGEFPESREGYLLGRQEAEACIGRQVLRETDRYGILLSCDVGAGEYRDKSIAIVALVSGQGDFGPDARRVQVVGVPIRSNTRKLQDFAGLVFTEACELENVTTLIDAGGMGIAVCQHLETLGLPEVVRVKWGNPCFNKRNKERFFNLRAQAMVCAARAAKEGRLGIVDGPWKKELLDQMSRTPYHFDEKARYVMERKEDMRAAGIPSPDLFDAIAFLFLEGVHYMICEGQGQLGGGVMASVKSQARGLFAHLRQSEPADRKNGEV
ncbi:hypothetical protein HZU77_006980 [Neisseriaceae bacterium TC5R-5]|nr:hypothetical protein [Neisseriaceae bacterium TC5R-5]